MLERRYRGESGVLVAHDSSKRSRSIPRSAEDREPLASGAPHMRVPETSVSSVFRTRAMTLIVPSGRLVTARIVSLKLSKNALTALSDSSPDKIAARRWLALDILHRNRDDRQSQFFRLFFLGVRDQGRVNISGQQSGETYPGSPRQRQNLRVVARIQSDLRQHESDKSIRAAAGAAGGDLPSFKTAQVFDLEPARKAIRRRIIPRSNARRTSPPCLAK